MGYAHNNNTKIKLEQEPLQVVHDSAVLKVSLDQSFIELEEYPDSFLDSLLNFDGWVEHHPNSSVAQVMNSEEKPILEIKTEEEVIGSEKLGDLIQEGMGKVCITAGADVIDGLASSEATGGDENSLTNDVKQETQAVSESVEAKGVNENDSEEDSSPSPSPSPSSSSSSSSSDDDEEEEEDDDDDGKVKGEMEMEEGEIREEMVSWSEDEEDVGVAKGPIRSKNEVQDLPPVPPVNVTIEPHHQTNPVGVVLSIMGAQVIVEGVENHNPLSEGSILWITETRSALGVVDEIFGPVKNPYYIVRYNSESQVPTEIQQGSLISFVSEFADYVLNNNNLYKKGYDASGENDEELSDELEFSDDEKEAEHKRMLKMSKRGSNEQKNGHMKKDKKSRNRGGNWKNESRSSGGPTGGPGMSLVGQPGPPGPPPPNFTGPGSGVWQNGFQSVPPQNMDQNMGQTMGQNMVQNMGFPPFMQQNYIQQPPFQNLGMPNLAPFHPQFNTMGPNMAHMFPSNFVQNVAPNMGANPSFGSWPAGMPQNNFNQPQVGPPPMGFPGFSGPPINGIPMGNGFHMENNGAMRPPFVAGNAENLQNPNQGKGFSSRGGRGGGRFQRGGGRFRGGRGRQQSG